MEDRQRGDHRECGAVEARRGADPVAPDLLCQGLSAQLQKLDGIGAAEAQQPDRLK